MTEDQYKRFMKTNDAAERIRKYIESWDMAESPEQLEIEALDHETAAREELAFAEDKRARARVLREGGGDEFEKIKEEYDHHRVGEKDRETQLRYLVGVHDLSKKKANEFLAHYGPGPEEGDDD
jgi:hypothetical protein